MVMLQTAEMNRDPKKSRKPFRIEDFCIYTTEKTENLPSSRYGAAAMALIQRREMPGWALFVFNDLKQNAKKSDTPSLLSYSCEDVIILAPQVSDDGLNGMLIARVSASKSIRLLKGTDGSEVRVIIPEISSSVYAEEDVMLDVMSILR